MDIKTRNVVNLVKSALTGKAEPLSDTIDAQALIAIMQAHNIYTLIHYGIFYNQLNLDEAFRKELDMVVYHQVMISEEQMYYIEALSRAFEAQNIQYMLLKGSLLKERYPRSEMRRMGDIDILIQTEQYSKIEKILKEMGFQYKNESNHEYVWKKNHILIELHKRLVPSYNYDFDAYYKSGWQFAQKTDTSRYVLTDEDMFVYLFGHFAKHYRDAGIGITHMCDLYIFQEQKELDWDYIQSELKTLQLYDFYCNINKTIDVWFRNAPDTDITDHITNVIFGSGVYGLRENRVISSVLKESRSQKSSAGVTFSRLLRYLFPSYNGMKTRYQILKKIPVLLPLFWIWRWITLGLFRRKEIQREWKDTHSVSAGELKDYENALRYVGLDYFF